MTILPQRTLSSQRLWHATIRLLTACLSALVINFAPFAILSAQSPETGGDKPSRQGATRSADEPQAFDRLDAARNVVAPYVDPQQGASSLDLVRRALASNTQLAAARLDIERARARLRQAGLRPNPTVDFEQTTGRWTDSPGERGAAIGFALPLELGGKRQRRVDLARADLEAAEAEVADRERRLAADVRGAYADAMAALRDLEITGELNTLDVQTARIVEARVSEGDAAPLELNLLRVEVDRLRARRSLVEGRLQAAERLPDALG